MVYHVAMFYINKIMMEGRICSELKRWERFVSFAIAVDTTPFDKNDKRTCFFDVTLTDRMADKAVKMDDAGYLKKGRVVLVEGRFQFVSKEKSGAKKDYFRIVASSFSLDSQRDSHPQQQSQPRPQQQYQPQPQPQPQAQPQQQQFASNGNYQSKPQPSASYGNEEADDIPF